MKFGLLKERITLQQYSSTKDEWNHETKSWANLHQIWASKKYKNSSLVSEVEGVVHIMQVTFTIRYLEGITTKMRVREGTEYFDIVGMKMLGRREGLELITIQRDADSTS